MEDSVLNESQQKLIISGWGNDVYENTEVKKIVYESDGMEVQGFLAYPVNAVTSNIESEVTKLPLIIWNRGGSKNDGRIDDFLAKGIFGEIASWGYVVLASNYREEDEFGGRDVNDVLNLISAADELEFCDTERIGMEGWSRGGMMTYKVLCLTSKIKCAVIVSGLADLFRCSENYNGLENVFIKLFGTEDEQEFINRKKERSAVYFTEKINKETEILLIHGTKDEKISFQDSVDMFELLKRNGNKCELKIIEGGDHYLRKHKTESTELRRNWFDRFLKQK